MKILLTILTLCAFTVTAPADEPDYQARIKQIGQIASSATRDTLELKKNLKESVAINESQGKELGAVKVQITKLSDVLTDTLKENKDLKAAANHEVGKGIAIGVIGSLIVVGLIHARKAKAKPVPEPLPSPEPDRSIPSTAKPPRRKSRPTAKRK